MGQFTKCSYIHCVEGGFYLCQYQYECDTCGRKSYASSWRCVETDENGKEVGETDLELFKERIQFPILHEKYGVSRKLRSKIISLMNSTISTDGVMDVLGHARSDLYVKDRMAYMSAVRSFKESTGSKDVFADFGKMDAANGYNEMERMSKPFMIQIFNDYIDSNKQQLNECLHNAEITEAISFDTTMKIQSRTRIFNRVTRKCITVREKYLLIS